MRYFIRISYNGKNYNGWQVQVNSSTVQSTLNNALTTIFKEEIHTTGAGRTDTGVHASEFYSHFDLSHKLAVNKIESYVYRLNGILPPDIAVMSIFQVREDSHARFSALTRTYKYYISRQKDPFNNELAYYLYGKLNVKLMNEAAKLLMEHSDFTSFSKSHTNTKTNNCKIHIAEWEEISVSQEPRAESQEKRMQYDMLVFTIKADRFLRNMVRAIVGTLIDVGRGKINIKEFKKIIENKNRSDAGYSVPAHGLFLTNIEYPINL